MQRKEKHCNDKESSIGLYRGYVESVLGVWLLREHTNIVMVYSEAQCIKWDSRRPLTSSPTQWYTLTQYLSIWDRQVAKGLQWEGDSESLCTPVEQNRVRMQRHEQIPAPCWTADTGTQRNNGPRPTPWRTLASYTVPHYCVAMQCYITHHLLAGAIASLSFQCFPPPPHNAELLLFYFCLLFVPMRTFSLEWSWVHRVQPMDRAVLNGSVWYKHCRGSPHVNPHP